MPTVSKEAKGSSPTPRDMNQSAGAAGERMVILQVWTSAPCSHPPHTLTFIIVITHQQGPNGKAEEDEMEKLICKGRGEDYCLLLSLFLIN